MGAIGPVVAEIIDARFWREKLRFFVNFWKGDQRFIKGFPANLIEKADLPSIKTQLLPKNCASIISATTGPFGPKIRVRDPETHS